MKQRIQLTCLCKVNDYFDSRLIDVMAQTSVTSTQHIAQPSQNLSWFNLFWAGQFISLLGSSIVQFSIVWWLTITYQSPAILGFSVFAGWGSTIVTIMLSGVLVDRWLRKNIIGLADGLQAFTSVLLVLLFYSGYLNLIVIFSFLVVRGVLQGFHQIASNTIVPQIVPREKLSRINGIINFSNGVSNFMGPLIGAFFIGLFGTKNLGYIFLIDTITFLVAVIPLIALYIPKLQARPKKSFIQDFSEGVSFIKQKEGLLAFISISPASNFFLTPLNILLPLLIINRYYYNGGAETLAYALAAFQVGFILSSFIFSTRKVFSVNSYGIVVGISFWITGTSVVVIGALSQSFLLLLLGQLLSGIAIPVHNVNVATFWHKIIPPELQGRVIAVRRGITQITGVIAILGAGLLSDRFGSLRIISIGAFCEAILLILYVWKIPFKDIEMKYTKEREPQVY